jgi:hypothetical protein
MIRDENRDLIYNFEGLLALCGGDAEKAETVRRILYRSYRNERHQIWKHRHYAALWIGGELVYLKHPLRGMLKMRRAEAVSEND